MTTHGARSFVAMSLAITAATAVLAPLSAAAAGATGKCPAATVSRTEPVPVDPCDPRVAAFSTVGAFTELTFGAGGVPPIPPDFFFPGSEPFEGGVALSGFPLVPGEGDADSAVELAAVPRPEGDGFPARSNPVGVRLAGLALSSIDPITVGGADGEGDEWLVAVGLAGDQSEGTLSARFDSPEGGSFDAVLPLVPGVLFVRLADLQAALDGEIDESEIAVRHLDLGAHGLEAIELTFRGVPFATADLDGDGCGGFEAAFLPDGEPVLVSTAEPFEPVRHVFEPPPPPAKKCRYTHASSTASANPVCLPACPAAAAPFGKGQCQTTADCQLFQTRQVQCTQQGWCAEIYVLTGCS